MAPTASLASLGVLTLTGRTCQHGRDRILACFPGAMLRMLSGKGKACVASSSGIPARLHIESVWWYAREWTFLLSVFGALFALLELGAGFLALGAAQARSCC